MLSGSANRNRKPYDPRQWALSLTSNPPKLHHEKPPGQFMYAILPSSKFLTRRPYLFACESTRVPVAQNYILLLLKPQETRSVLSSPKDKETKQRGKISSGAAGCRGRHQRSNNFARYYLFWPLFMYVCLPGKECS